MFTCNVVSFFSLVVLPAKLVVAEVFGLKGLQGVQKRGSFQGKGVLVKFEGSWFETLKIGGFGRE